MGLADAIYLRLVSDFAITAIVSDRVYPLQAPQSVSLDDDGPYVVYQVAGDETPYHNQGEGGFVSVLVQFDCYGATYDAANNLKEKLRLNLSGFRGTSASVEIRGCFLETTRDLSDLTADQKEKRVARMSCDYEIQHRQTVPS